MLNEKITMLTAYDEETAAILSKTTIDFIFVGDSVLQVKYGFRSTRQTEVRGTPVMDIMVKHTRQVKRGAKEKHVVADMPFDSYHNAQRALSNAEKLISAGADSVKLEGGVEVAYIIEYLTKNGIKVMGHLGYTPQKSFLRAYGRDIKEIRKLVEDSLYLQNAGAFAVVLEMMYSEVANVITQALNIPTIGIGSGPFTKGQVLVINDILGLSVFSKKPKFVKRFLKGNENPNNPENIKKAVEDFIMEVRTGKYPMPWHYHQLYEKISMIELLNLKLQYRN
jgi:3-methyl-2-oxobutanoate hydroxymethyltransferase